MREDFKFLKNRKLLQDPQIPMNNYKEWFSSLKTGKS